MSFVAGCVCLFQCDKAIPMAILTMFVDEQVVMMGAAKVGKSSLISQFLYGTFSDKYKRTVEEMHQVQKKLK